MKIDLADDGDVSAFVAPLPTSRPRITEPEEVLEDHYEANAPHQSTHERRRR